MSPGFDCLVSVLEGIFLPLVLLHLGMLRSLMLNAVDLAGPFGGDNGLFNVVVNVFHICWCLKFLYGTETLFCEPVGE